MKRWMICLSYAIFPCTCFIYAEGDIVDKLIADPINCSKEELLTFFPQPVIQAVLLRADVSQEQAVAIASELSQKNRGLLKLVETKAAQLTPRPFENMSQRELAKLYQETLYEIFAASLKSHGVTNDEKIQTLMEDLRTTHSKLFLECIHKQQATPSTASSNEGD